MLFIPRMNAGGRESVADIANLVEQKSCFDWRTRKRSDTEAAK
jgi:hypothetical protein